MRDKIVVDLAELLAIANGEYVRRPAFRAAPSITHIAKGAGTFVLTLGGDTPGTCDTADCTAFAQSLYDRYLLKI